MDSMMNVSIFIKCTSQYSIQLLNMNSRVLMSLGFEWIYDEMKFLSIKFTEMFYTVSNSNKIWICVCDSGKRRYNIKLWKTFTDCFNCLPVAAIVDEKIFCCHGGLSPDLQSMENIRRIMRPTDVPDQGLLCDLLWSDPDKVNISSSEWIALIVFMSNCWI